ncbi:MAG: hypothetical protein Q9212_007579, partial [Teloschistes hypoglaucus]
ITAHQAFSSSSTTTNSRPLFSRRTQSQRSAWTAGFPIHVDVDARHTMEGMDQHLGLAARARERRRPVVPSVSPTRDQENLRMHPAEMEEYLAGLERAENEAQGIQMPVDEADEMLVDSPMVQRPGWLHVNQTWDW